MKLMEKMKQKKLGNKGFSLVEMIIVIAIMAILIGIVGTQVVPYLNRAREEKDMQTISAFSTAGVSWYSLNTELFGDTAVTITLTDTQDGTSKINYKFENLASTTNLESKAKLLQELTGYAKATDVGKAMSSKGGKLIKAIVIKIDPKTSPGTVTATAYKETTLGDDNKVLRDAESIIGVQQ